MEPGRSVAAGNIRRQLATCRRGPD